MGATTVALLEELLDGPDEPRYGLELSRATGIKSGTLYPILHRLVEAGWAEATWEDTDPAVAGRGRRRYYRLTPEARSGAPARISATRTGPRRRRAPAPLHDPT